MPTAVANTSLSNTFDFLRNRVNELAHAMSTTVLTIDDTISGNLVVNGYITTNTLIGTYFRGGTLGVANTLTITSNVVIATGNTLSIGNSTVNVTTNSSSITISGGMSANSIAITAYSGYFGNSSANVVVSNTGAVFSNSSATFGNSTVNVAVSSTGISINAIPVLATSVTLNVQTSGTSAQLIDSLLLASYRAAEYVLTVKDNAANSFQMNKSLVIHDGGTAYLNEYAVISSNADLGTLSANANSTYTRIYFTPTVSNTQVKGQRTIVVI